MEKEKYEIFGISMAGIRNRNETKVIQFMNELIPQFPAFDYCTICLQDVYALSLNQLSPHYTQDGTIIFKKDLQDADYRDVVEASITAVIKNVNHPT
ncbi:MAG: late competence development ComFB family protein [Deltaproteobacteria bacterium]|nr:late competence development ComFB family protein [Deltaproteobacteria bacterium]MBT4268254.1 late competence development ComFB family protein [Deltaproteobacteria bacterium]MBT4639097.1 late competence development ComFB family protein [Deltaproteobacteria bacterium]MBT6501171.1 late competence development ComFB family protein [Deltaproteobacteria bacterium]MBT6616205.1 late competence development ComFB family protein [Deltaproteobacteria bacterium]